MSRNSKRRRRDFNKKHRQENVAALRGLIGFSIEELTPYQFRINGELDIYPTSGKYFVLDTGKWGKTTDVADFVRKFGFSGQSSDFAEALRHDTA